MRSEEFERILRRLQLAASRGTQPDVLDAAPYVAAHPWDAVFSRAAHPAALDAQAFWNAEVREQAL
eukprot:9185710-Lingulodinium_polyedra.AAC.1